MPLIELLKQIQYPVMILTSRLKQLVLIPKGVLVQQTMATTLPINIHIANGLPIHGNDVLFQQPKRTNAHPSLDGEQPKGLPDGGSLRGGKSPN